MKNIRNQRAQFTFVVVFAALLSLTVCACKKTEESAIRFGFLTINNQTQLADFDITYNDKQLLHKSTSPYKNIKIPEGAGKLKVLDAKGKSLTESTLDIKANENQELLLFQPVADLKPIFLKNNQKDEPKPVAGHLKVKAAYFGIDIFQKPVDLILYYSDPETFDLVEMGRIENFSKEFSPYLSLSYPYALNTFAGFVTMVVDHESQEPILDFYVPFNPESGKNVYTIYYNERTEGSRVIGTPYFVSGAVLFAD